MPLRLYHPSAHIHAGVLAIFALAIQASAIFVPLGADGVPKRLLFQLSYLLLIYFVAINRRRIGLLIIGLGLVLNFLPIVANGGLMPVAPEALAEIDQLHRIEGLDEGDAIANTKNLLKERENTRLWTLSDRLVWDNPVFFRVFSIGDVVIGAGLIVTLAELFLPRPRRTSLDPATRNPETGPPA